MYVWVNLCVDGCMYVWVYPPPKQPFVLPLGGCVAKDSWKSRVECEAVWMSGSPEKTRKPPELEAQAISPFGTALVLWCDG